jgi:ferredoxin-NADP reductase
MAGPVPFKVRRIIQSAPGVKTLYLVPVVPGSFSFDFKPGQFVNLMIQRPGEPLMARPYSISSSPTNKEYLELTIKILDGGRFTSKVDQLKEGDEVKIGGPFGRFFFLDEERMKSLVLIGGGCGTTPFISMVRYINDRKLPIKTTYVYSCRTPAHILFREELAQIANKNKDISLVFTTTREWPSDWKFETGRINPGMLRKHINIDTPGQYYMICGPTEMANSTVRMLKGMGIADEFIISESWGGSA